jgi:hypothetical protein
MRKNLLLVLGLALIVGSAISFVDASRYQYHQLQRAGYTTPNYQASRSTSVYRPHSVSYVNPYANAYRSNFRNQYKAQCDLRTQYGCHYFNRQALYSPAKDRLDYKLQRPQLNPRIENTMQSNRLVVRNGDFVDRTYAYLGEPKIEDLAVVDATYYTVDTTAFNKDGSGTYRNNQTSLAFRVLQSPSSYKCSQTNFWSCVAQLSRNFRTSQNLTNAVSLNQDMRWNDTQALSFAKYPTVTENFQANGRTYYTFSALNPVDGSIVRIEGVASARDQNIAAQAMFQVFESFRFQQ